MSNAEIHSDRCLPMARPMLTQLFKICRRSATASAAGTAALLLLSGCSAVTNVGLLSAGGSAITPDPFVVSQPNELAACVSDAEATLEEVASAERDQMGEGDIPAQTGALSETTAATVRMTSFEVPAMATADTVEQSHEMARQPAGTPVLQTSFHPAVPRLPSLEDSASRATATVYAADPAAAAYPDEYIYDGGDRNYPVHYYGGEIEGLDTEDTVAEYKDHLGRNNVRPTNRVAIYAPRFGAVQSVSGLRRNVKVDRAVGADNYRGLEALNNDRGLETNIHNSSATGVAVRASASGFETSESAHRSKRVDGIVQNEKVDQGLQAWNRTGLGTVQTSDVFELNLQFESPLINRADTVAGQRSSTQQATSTWSTFKPAATVGVERDVTPGRIAITKEASTLVAQTGDEITFKIRFRNVGRLPVQEVRIIDNLTPRLIYVDGSGELELNSDGGGGLVVTPNEEGSQRLTFELDNPLRGGESGSVTFRAIVR